MNAMCCRCGSKCESFQISYGSYMCTIDDFKPIDTIVGRCITFNGQNIRKQEEKEHVKVYGFSFCQIQEAA